MPYALLTSAQPGLERAPFNTILVHWMVQTTRSHEHMIIRRMSRFLDFEGTARLITYDSSDTNLFSHPSKGRVFFQNITKLLPRGVLTWLSERGREESLVMLRRNRAEVHRVAWKLVELKREELKAGTSRRDVLSLLGSPPNTCNCEGGTHKITQ